MIIIVGCGGIGGHLIQHFMQATDELLYLVDGDRVEEGNLGRQLFLLEDVGLLKAEAMCLRLGPRVTPVARYLQPLHIQQTGWTEGATLILSAVDNHTARRLCLELADVKQIPCVLMGNEESDAEAFYYLPEMRNSPADPRILVPELLRDTDPRDPTRSCLATLERARQTRLANLTAATLGLNLLAWWSVLHEAFASCDPQARLKLQQRAPIRISYRAGSFHTTYWKEPQNVDL